MFSSMASKPIYIRLIRTGSQTTKKLFIVSYFRQFSTDNNIEIKMIILKPVLLAIILNLLSAEGCAYDVIVNYSLSKNINISIYRYKACS